jgi:tartrate-resistant acid phosphatase type 5
MPSLYYTFMAGPVQFFAIDTTDLSIRELHWLDSELGRSKARWKVVYGHNPIFSAYGEDDALYKKLFPLLRGRVDVYLTGHHHNLQELKSQDGVHFFVSGGGGAQLYDLDPSYNRSLFQRKLNGFTVLEADAKQMRISFIGSDGKQLYSRELEK